MDTIERRPRVLVVDDEDSIRELLTTSLRFDGFEVYCAADGIQALELAQHLDLDLVVLDVLLPGMSGFAVTHALRQRGCTIPVLFLSACDEPADRRQGLAVGGNDYVVKPFSLKDVRTRIRALIQAPRALAPARSHAAAG